MSDIKLVVLDVAGTTAKDDGLVVKAFTIAIEPLDPTQEELIEMINYVNATMGQRKIDVFMHLCGQDVGKAEAAEDRFVEAYSNLVAEGLLEEFDGVSEFFKMLRSKGIGIALTTGFPRSILDFILEELNWAELIDISVAASEVALGRPAPDMIERAIDLYNQGFGKHVTASEVAVAGDTESDIKAGLAAGVKIVAGVTSGSCTRAQLEASGATLVLNYTTELISHL
jgi:hypothetical protein